MVLFEKSVVYAYDKDWGVKLLGLKVECWWYDRVTFLSVWWGRREFNVTVFNISFWVWWDGNYYKTAQYFERRERSKNGIS